MNTKQKSDWVPYLIAAIIFVSGIIAGMVSNIQLPTEPTPVLADAKIDWQTEAVEAWALVVILPGELEDKRQKCETVRSVRQCAWMMQRMEFGIRAIIQERMPEALRDALLPQQRSPS